MGDLKGILGLVASVFSLIGSLPYIRGVIRNTIKPHAFSWFVWGVTLATGFGIQMSEGAGAGAWSTGTGAISCLAIFFFALKKSDRSFSVFDWTCLAGAGVSFVLWRVTDQPVAAAIMLSLVDLFGFLPTFRKGYRKPHEDGLTPFTIGGLSSVLSIVALECYSLATWLYPTTIVITNILFTAMILRRRKRFPSITAHTAC